MISYISAAAHGKFVSLCKALISKSSACDQPVSKVEKNECLERDLEELERIGDAYKNILAELPRLTHNYYMLHRKIRIKIRKLQVQQIADGKKGSRQKADVTAA